MRADPQGLQAHVISSVILLAHGSPDPRHSIAVDAIADLVSGELGSTSTVDTAYLQHHGPTFSDAFSAARQSSAPTVLIQPLLLTAGEHWRNDVPQLMKDLVPLQATQLLEPPDPVGLLAAVLESLSPSESVSSAAGSTGNVPMPDSPATLPHNVLLVAGGSRVQDLRQHFRPLAVELKYSLGRDRGLPDPANAQEGSLSVGLCTRPTEVLEYRSSGPTTQIVPLLVSRGWVYDAMVEAAEQIGATVTLPVGETDAFARSLAARVIAHQEHVARA